MRLPTRGQVSHARSQPRTALADAIKQARRFATRYEKTLRNYAAVVAIGCALLWLRIQVAEDRRRDRDRRR
jgi:hypothetical protein